MTRIPNTHPRIRQPATSRRAIEHIASSPPKLTFSAAVELDGDLLIHVLAQIQDVLLLRPLLLLMLLLPSRTTSTASSPSTATTATTSAPSSMRSSVLGHGRVASKDGNKKKVGLRWGKLTKDARGPEAAMRKFEWGCVCVCAAFRWVKNRKRMQKIGPPRDGWMEGCFSVWRCLRRVRVSLSRASALLGSGRICQRCRRAARVALDVCVLGRRLRFVKNGCC